MIVDGHNHLRREQDLAVFRQVAARVPLDPRTPMVWRSVSSPSTVNPGWRTASAAWIIRRYSPAARLLRRPWLRRCGHSPPSAWTA